jgi:hypothetical protein
MRKVKRCAQDCCRCFSHLRFLRWMRVLMAIAAGVIASTPPTYTDIDGDGKSDLVVWRPSEGTRWITLSSNGAELNPQQLGEDAELRISAPLTGSIVNRKVRSYKATTLQKIPGQ